MAIIQKNTVANGFERFHLSDFRAVKTPLAEEVIKQLLAKLTHVQDLELSFLSKQPRDLRNQLLDFAAEVIKQHQAPITDLSFWDFLGWGEDTSLSDRKLVRALCESKETQIQNLNLGFNHGWWKDNVLRGPLVQFVVSQTQLSTLNIQGVNLTSDETIDVLKCLCKNAATIRDINAEFCFNFSEDESCKLVC